MPTYDYECSSCGHAFEVFEGVHAAQKKKCLKCGRKQARRLPGAGAGLVFRGSGFYTTDSKGGGEKKKQGDVKEGSSEKTKTKTKTKSKTEQKEKK